MEKLFTSAAHLRSKVFGVLAQSFWVSLALVWLLIFMLVASLAIYRITPTGHYTWLLLMFVGWWSFGVIAYHSPHNWLLFTLLSGNEYRFSKRYRTTALIVAKHATASTADTRAATKQHQAAWPYGEWYVNGERFLIFELQYNGHTYRSAVRVTRREYELASPGTTLPISYQLARSPNGPGKPVLVKL